MLTLRLHNLLHLAFSNHTLSNGDTFAAFDCKVRVIQQSLARDDGSSRSTKWARNPKGATRGDALHLARIGNHRGAPTHDRTMFTNAGKRKGRCTVRAQESMCQESNHSLISSHTDLAFREAAEACQTSILPIFSCGCSRVPRTFGTLGISSSLTFVAQCCHRRIVERIPSLTIETIAR